MSTSRVTRVVEVIAVGAIIGTAAVLALAPVPELAHWKAAAFFTVFGLLASVLGYKTSSATSGSIGFLPFLSIAVIAPNAAALATVFVSIVGTELIARRARLKATFNVAQFVFSEVVAIGTYLVLGGRSILEGEPPIVAFLGMVAVWLMLNKLAVSTVVSLAEGRDTKLHWVRSMRLSASYDLFAFPLIYFFAAAYEKFGLIVTSALALPMLGLRQQYKTNIALQRTNSELQQLSEELLQMMVANIEARDPYTSGHSQRVSRYARYIARTAGLTPGQVEQVSVAALLHDVGKVYEEFTYILRKASRLTNEEFEVMKSHSRRGADLIRKVSRFADLVPLVRSHHEAWNGMGYPDALVGEAIPLGARVIALADTVDAMSTSRPYRAARSLEDVRKELTRERGNQFDPQLCAAILAPSAWREFEAEIDVALSEYPVVQPSESTLEGIDLSPSPIRLAAS